MGVSPVGGSPIAALLQLSGWLRNPAKPGDSAAAASASTDELRETYRLSVSLRKALQELQKALRSSHPYTGRALPAAAVSGVTLLPLTYTKLTGGEEVNATPTSFSPFGPAWTRGSTSLATVTGVYSGTDGTAIERIRVTTGGTVGGGTPIVLRASVGVRNEDVTIPAGTPPGTPFTLSNGIVLKFSAGTILRNDDFNINLYSQVGSVVNPDKPFNGTRNNYPNFQYGLSVQAGSFTVNGVSINVAASDTLNQVLARITNSAAGVTAAFDAATETVSLTRNSAGSLPIALANDTSGFVAATKLAGASPVLGSYESGSPIASVPKLGGITSGWAAINGVAIAVDAQTDSMETLVARINTSEAQVTAAIVDGKIRITSGSPFTLENGTSNLFGGIGITEGEYGSRTRGGVAGGDAVIEAMKRVSTRMNELLGDSGASAPLAKRLRESFASIAARAFRKDGPQFDSRMGFRMDFASGATEALSFSRDDESILLQALKGNSESLRKLFLGSITGRGENFVDLLSKELRGIETEIEGSLGGTGLLIDVLA